MTESRQKRAVIGIDPGDHMAHCRVIDGAPHDVWCWDWEQKRGMSAGIRYLSFIPYLAKTLRGYQKDGPVMAVACEQMFHRGGHATDVLKGYEMNIQTVCDQLEIEHLLAPISSVKKFATGKGNASKDQMRAYLELWLDDKYLKAETLTEDMVDAVWIALWTWEKFSGSDSLA